SPGSVDRLGISAANGGCLHKPQRIQNCRGKSMSMSIDQSTAGAAAGTTPLVGVIMGSSSDWDVMTNAVAVVEEFGIPYEAKVVSAHRMPHDMVEYGRSATQRRLRAIIAGAGGAAHLPGMMAALTPVPVFGVLVRSRFFKCVDSLLSFVQLPNVITV